MVGRQPHVFDVLDTAAYFSNDSGLPYKVPTGKRKQLVYIPIVVTKS